MSEITYKDITTLAEESNPDAYVVMKNGEWKKHTPTGRPLHDLIMAADTRYAGDPWKLTYNATSGYYEMNGLTNLTYEDMLEIYTSAKLSGLPFSGWEYFLHGNNSPHIRTNFPYDAKGWMDSENDTYSLKAALASCDNIEVFIMISESSWSEGASGYHKVHVGDATFFCNAAAGMALKKILTPMMCEDYTFRYAGRPPRLETIYLAPAGDVPNILAGSPFVTYESLEYLVENARNAASITVVVHEEVWDKLNDTEETQWTQLNATAQMKGISFATD